MLWSIGGAVVVVLLVFLALAQFSQPSSSAEPTWKNLVHTVAHPAQAFKVASAKIQHKAIPTAAPVTPAPVPSQAATPSATTAPATVSKTDVAAHIAAKKRAQERALAAAAHKTKKTAALTIASTGSNVASASNSGPLAPIVQITPAPRRIRVATIATSAPTAQPETYIDPQLVRQAGADYPLMARDQGVQGTTVILVSVSTSGGVTSASVAQSSGNRLLDDAAVRAAYRSKFQAATKNGAPTASTARLVYTFSL